MDYQRVSSSCTSSICKKELQKLEVECQIEQLAAVTRGLRFTIRCQDKVPRYARIALASSNQIESSVRHIKTPDSVITVGTSKRLARIGTMYNTRITATLSCDVSFDQFLVDLEILEWLGEKHHHTAYRKENSLDYLGENSKQGTESNHLGKDHTASESMRRRACEPETPSGEMIT